MRRFLIVILVFMSLIPAADARRTTKDIRRERQATERKIKDTRRQISSNIDDTRRELNRLTSLEGDIRSNDARIARLTSRNDSLRRKTKILSDSVEQATAKVQRLKQSRASAMRAARRQRQTAGSASAFIFSSESFRQALRRASYLRDLARWQDSTATSLAREARVLEIKKASLDSTRKILKANIASLSEERLKLEQNSREAKTVVASLKRQGRNLEKVLKEQQRLAQKLDQELNRLIEEEARRAAEEARKKKEQEEAARRKQQNNTPSETPKKAQSSPAQPEPAQPGKPFADMKGKLPLPLDRNATVAVPFGLQTHAEYSKVKMQNNGIDLETEPGASARAVHEGTVSMVIVMEGYHNVVLVRHGEYLTVYAGLADLAVRKGQHVNAGDRIGSVYVDKNDDNRTRLHFEVRHEKEKLDPAQWIRLL
ncbi:MAG: peptidoglycan DD-metalloendopeptidase family protein [Muribaculaceae bacterium]|nr:peptidoglycan DD-metalloendopeptidase family protein [Muribaculaceae bacterium]